MTCPSCHYGQLVEVPTAVMVKRRSKFGLGWLLLTIFTCGFAILLYIVWPRHNEIVGYRPGQACSFCGFAT